MTEPSSAHPLPGPPRLRPAAPGSSAPANSPPPASSSAPASSPDGALPDETSFEELGQRPVSEHVAVFEDEHARLQRELGTIDQL